MTFWYRIFGKKRTAIDILNDGFRETQRIARGEAPKRKKDAGPFLLVAFIFGATEPDNKCCSDAVATDPAWKAGRVGKVQIHPCGGWDRNMPTQEMVYTLLEKMHPEIMPGVRSKQVFHDFLKIDNDHLLVSVYGSEFWKDYLSLPR